MIVSAEAIAQQRIQSQSALKTASQKMQLYQTLHSVTISEEVFDEVARAQQGVAIISRRIERLSQLGQLRQLTIKGYLNHEVDSE